MGGPGSGVLVGEGSTWILLSWRCWIVSSGLVSGNLLKSVVAEGD